MLFEQLVQVTALFEQQTKRANCNLIIAMTIEYFVCDRAGKSFLNDCTALYKSINAFEVYSLMPTLAQLS